MGLMYAMTAGTSTTYSLWMVDLPATPQDELATVTCSGVAPKWN